MKDVIIVGDSLDFVTSVPDFLPADGYTLKYRLTPRSSSGAAIVLTASTSGTDYRIQVAPTTSAAWTAGEYGWFAWVEKSGVRKTVDEGLCTLKPDPAVMVAGTDTRSNARKAVDQLEALMGGGYSPHVKEYEIAGRRMVFQSPSDVSVALSRARADVWRENAAAAMAAGLPNPRNVLVRFARG